MKRTDLVDFPTGTPVHGGPHYFPIAVGITSEVAEAAETYVTLKPAKGGLAINCRLPTCISIRRAIAGSVLANIDEHREHGVYTEGLRVICRRDLIDHVEVRLYSRSKPGE